MIQRILEESIVLASGKMPVLAVTGPRQSGKSTLIRHAFPSHRYLNLEDPELRGFAREDPKGLLRFAGDRVILDEIQHVPELLSYIQVEVDRQEVPGQFVLSGSQNLLLMAGVAQSLAGRVAIFNLLPFSLEELHRTPFELPRFESYIHTGFYPRIYDKQLDAGEWLKDYIQTYVERDLRQIINVSNLGLFRQFLSLCAGRIGQLVNFSSIGSMIGVSYQTIKSWLSVLETSFIIYLVQPYHRNFNKRIVKSPKLYFYDTGLACALLNIRRTDDLQFHFAKGALFENFIINEILKNHINRNRTPGHSFWQASGSHEVDLLLDKGGQLFPIEIKSGSTIHPHFFDSLKYFQSLSGAAPDQSFIVYGGEDIQQRSSARVISWRALSRIPI